MTHNIETAAQEDGCTACDAMTVILWAAIFGAGCWVALAMWVLR